MNFLGYTRKTNRGSRMNDVRTIKRYQNRKLYDTFQSCYVTLEEIAQTVVSSSGTQITYLKDIAEVSFEYEESTYLGRLNGKRAVFITATQKKNTNIFELNDQITPIIENFANELPSSYGFEKSFDQAQSVSKRLLGLAKDFGIAILLVMITLIPLGWRAALIVMISIPLSLSIGLAWYLSKMGSKAATEKYSYGFKRLSLMGAMINGVILVIGSVWVLSEAIPRLANPEMPVTEGMIGLAILGIFVNGFAAYKLHGGHSMNEKVLNWHLIEDTMGWAAVLIFAIVLAVAGAITIQSAQSANST